MKLTRNKSERPRRENDFYPTPYGLAHEALLCFQRDEHSMHNWHILDAGCGKGIWMDAANEVGSGFGGVYGIDLEPDPSLLYARKGDFLAHNAATMGLPLFDLVMGNPPYSLMEEFVRHSLQDSLLLDHGYVFFMCRLEFLASKTRCYGLYAEHPLKRVYVLSRRPSFFSTNGRRTTDAQDYAMFLWQKGYTGKTELSWLYWDYDQKRDIIEQDIATAVRDLLAQEIAKRRKEGQMVQGTIWREDGQD